MLCEDEFIVAMDLQLLLEDLGFEVIGPFGDVSDGLSWVEEQLPDVAVLDVNLRDGPVFPLADVLKERGVHLVFHSGHADHRDIEDRYPGSTSCPKPVSGARLKDALLQKVD